jgi:hypothetical protein
LVLLAFLVVLMWNELTLRNFSKVTKSFAFLWKIPLNEGESSMDNFSSIPKEIN